MGSRGCFCVLILTAAVMAAGNVEKPSPSRIAALLRSPAQDVRSYEDRQWLKIFLEYNLYVHDFMHF